MNRHQPITCERVRSARLHTQPAATHVDHTVLFLVDGQLRMEHGGPIVAEPGMAVLVPSGAPHRLVGGSGVEVVRLTFCASCLGFDEGAPLMGPFRSVRWGALPLVVIPEARRAHLLRVCEELVDEVGHDTLESREVQRSLLVLVLAELRRAPASPAASDGSREGSLVASALEFIQGHCYEPISLKDVARAVHRTPAHVTTVLRRVTGFSVGHWIKEARLREACIRLAHTDDSIVAIAGHIGWKDETHFIRQFRKSIGSTPAAWRRTHRGKIPDVANGVVTPGGTG
ncbi:helix-turn-helix domain-containing protein [Pendulispora albinea]|uniref:AraC family transcriptional regulator n=1 Tax=Pendulispora albinea TaxID=2741071 RepID=A0ABZ2LYA9_9BACT